MPALNIYFLHCKSLAMRKPLCEKLHEKLTQQLTGYTINVKYVTQFDPEDVSCMNPASLMDITPSEDTVLNTHLRPLSIPALSNALKHCAALRAISNNTSTDDDYNLVLEDDVCFSEGVTKQLSAAIDKLRSGDAWDIVFLGFPAVRDANDKSPEVPTIENALTVHKVLPGCDSYFVSKRGAARLSKDFLRIKFEGNIHLTYLIKKGNLDAYVYTPNIFVEGSKLGTYISSINTNNLLIYNQVFREMFSLVQMNTAYTPQDIVNFGKLWEMTPYKEHPDFMYLKALFLLKQQKYNESKVIFEKCFEQYKKNNCVINKDSVFLNNYIELCKVIQ
jgi:GR25 family glycosyltransferase involved in LPS biosynthesis